MVCVFTRNTSEPLASLVKQIDAKVGEKSGLKSFVVVIPKKDETPKDAIKKLAETASIKNVPITLGEPGDGPPDYEISRNADITITLWHEHKVKTSRAFKGELTAKDIDEVMGDVTKLLAK